MLWALSLAAVVGVALLLLQLYRDSTAAQVQRAEAVIARACDMIRDRYAFYTSGWSGDAQAEDDAAFRRELNAVVALALARQPGVEGGIWQSDAGPLAYAFPTYQGTGPKTDLPEAERSRIASVNAEAAQEEQALLRSSVAREQTLLIEACPLGGPIAGMTGWTMMRVNAAPGYSALRFGLGLLLALMAGMAAWLTWLGASWGRHVRGIETALAGHDIETLPHLNLTGERELDRIVAALNEAGARLAGARQRSAEMSARVAASERLAALGRVAAGIAHEIRNPIAAMRLKAENALAGDDTRRRVALHTILGQIARLDRLIAELLAMTQRRDPVASRVDVAQFVADCALEHRDAATRAGVSLESETTALSAFFDPDLIRRALDNLILNALRHTPAGGRVTLRAEEADGLLRLSVEDTGTGVPPELCGHVFEPFVTGHADGTGLGLAIARELAEAQGGRVVLDRPGGDAPGRGAIFTIELPWHAS